METINFTEDEITVLHDAVKSYLAEMRTEISYTETRDFKAALKHRQEILQHAMDKLAAAVTQMA